LRAGAGFATVPNMLRMFHAAAAAALLTTAAHAAQPIATRSGDGDASAAGRAFQALLADHWAAAMRESPVLATTLGVRDYDDKLGDQSLGAKDRRAAEAAGFLKRAEAVPEAGLNAADRVSRAILIRNLREQIEGNGFGQRAILFTSYSSWFAGFADLPDRVPLFDARDYRSYIDRLRAFPTYNRQGIETTRTALSGGYVQPCDALERFDRTISGVIVDTPEQSVWWKPFTRPKPASISDAEWAQLQVDARTAITGAVVPAYRELLAFYTADYAPRCAKAPGVSAQPNGAAYYAFRVRAETTTDMTPDEVHRLGLSEVARIRAAMDKVAADAGFPGDRTGYVARLRSDPKSYVTTPDALLEYSAAMAKRIDGELPRLFGRLPRLTYTVKPIPAATAEGTTTAYYEQGAPLAGRPGVYRVNTTHLDQRPLWEVPALTSHEAVPGHHFQIALQQELDLPLFRRHLSYATSFTEGWGLYAELLGEEMGLYDTPERRMGRLSYEMWRACRLVVDTGIHAKGWTKAQAVTFMRENTALSDKNIDAEVNRYISWPGQALAYKIGELKIRALRQEAEAKLGAKFDERAFHDAVLENGSVPLSVLEAHIRAWIATRAG